MPLRYRITTLGCRVNHAESRDIESLLLSRGLEPATGGDADVEVIHTCSVTNVAAAKSRQAIRRARRRRPDRLARPEAAVFVTGCYASTDPGDVAAITGRPDRVVAHHVDDAVDADAPLERLARSLDRWLDGDVPDRRDRPLPNRPHTERRPDALLPLPVMTVAAASSRHVRAELKIQDGCDAHCSFCIIPKIRPTLRSKRIVDAVAEARRLIEHGHREIVLTGIFIGAFGHETALRRRQREADASPLADLLDAVARIPGLERLRISSMEPGDVTTPLLDAMLANERVVVPHLHLPLQSGADRVLRRMNRQYSIGEYLDMIDQVNETLSRPSPSGTLPPAITTDVICGFPAETADDFAETEWVARRVGYLHMHVFPFSPKRGTAAARWRDRFVPGPEVRRRVRRLIELEEDPEEGLSVRFRRRLLGRSVRVILEQAARGEKGVMMGRCDHYALVHVRTERPRGTLMSVRVSEVTATRTWGESEPRCLPLPVLAAGPRVGAAGEHQHV